MRLLDRCVVFLGIGAGIFDFTDLNVTTLDAAGLAVVSIAAFLVIAGVEICVYGLYKNRCNRIDDEDEISAPSSG